jgi:hypothetical protein
VKFKIGIFILFFIIISCKPKSYLSEGKAKTDLETKTIIQNHYNTKNDFETLYIKSSARYEDDNQTQNVTAEIRIKKDEKILVSIRFLGITMAKALITPKEVKYYEKINGTYFEGDFKTLSEWLGTDLDYHKVQNILLGQPFEEMKNGSYKNEIVDRLHKLSFNNTKFEKSFYFESERFLLKRQEITQFEKERVMIVSYPKFEEFSGLILPSNLNIFAFQKKGKTTIDIDYKSITKNEELTFPYSVPEGYQQLYIN